MTLPAGIAGVSLHGVDDPLLYLFHNAHMVCRSVLAFVLIVPLKKDQVAGARLIATVLPQPSLPESLGPNGAACEPGDHAGIQIAALVGTPGNKAGVPVHPTLKVISGPIAGPAHITKLG